jgi:2-polyprenyl-3-methyl-5-hydroxy-6-metoxy-1,4-benzoquinol methylase
VANARNKNVDTTHLSWESTADRLIFHRDTQAHFLRWSHVLKHLQNSKNRGKSKILELGCGKELPLPRLLYSNRCVPSAYCGVDYRKNLDQPDMLKKVIADGKYNFKTIAGQDAATVTLEQIGFTPDVIVSFECLEHVEPAHIRRILKHARSLLSDDGVFFMSTPCWDPSVGAADNHVSEVTFEAMSALLQDVGFVVKNVWGTFASIKDYEDALIREYGDAGRLMFNKLRDYYDTNILANIFAPLFPQYSRNALWELEKADKIRKPQLTAIDGQWTSSDKWEELAHD